MQNKKFNKTIEKKIEPKFFALIVEYVETTFLSIQYAYTLEEAFTMAKIEFSKISRSARLPKPIPIDAKIGLFTSKTLEELSDNRPTIDEIIKEASYPSPETIEKLRKIEENPKHNMAVNLPQMSEKNTLMQAIISSNDPKMLEDNAEQFTKFELKFLKAQLKLNKKSSS